MNERRALRVAFGLVALVCAVLYVPGLDAGYLADDLFQISMLEERMGSYSIAHLYAFAPGDAETNAAHVQRGSLPWWTHPEFRFVMVRPLSSLLLTLDHFVAPRNAYVHHLHSALWFGGVLVMGYVLLRRVLGQWIAVVAVASFAVDETMTWMIAWLANRCALVCTVFAFTALWVHIRASRDPGAFRGRGQWLELVLWLGAFAGGEYAVGGVAYLGGYMLLGERRDWKVRVASLWPAAVALLAFVVAYIVLGGGVYGGTTYVDPFRETGQFFSVMGHRVPRMAGEVWANWAGESERFWMRYADSGLSERVMPSHIDDLGVQAYRHGAFAIATSLAWVVPTWLLARRFWSEDERRAIRWIVLGSVFALLPISAIPPATRALMLPNFGAAAFVGAALVAFVRALRGGTMLSRVGLGMMALVIGNLHFVREFGYTREHLDAILGAQRAYAQYYRNEAFAQLDLRGKHVVVVSTPGLVTGIHGVSMMHVLGMQAPKTWHVLGIGPRPYTLRRIGERKLELSSVGGAMHQTPQEVLFRNAYDALGKGDRVDAGLFVAEVLNDRNGTGPGSVLFEFRWPLDDPRIVVLEVGPEGLRPFALPEPGTVKPLSPPALPNAD
ncbi:MAG: hypothetical protein ACE37F_31880 [Nannocystaceae bacterium]|nr:hypothetical protein [bacterium]